MKQKRRCCWVFEAIFENDNGSKFTFGINGSNFFGMNVGDAVDITLGTSQGFSQIGETVETMSAGGRAIDVTGKLFGNIVERKNALRNVCTPFATGRLVFQGTHYIRVYVKSPPSFSAVKNNGLFKMQFYAPFPYFSTFGESHNLIGGIIAAFRLPINYSKPHRFGTRSSDRYTNIVNSGDIRVPFKLVMRSEGISTNPTVSNLQTFGFLRINGTLNSGEYITVYRDNSNVLRAELTQGNIVTDVIDWLDDESSLFELEPGDNLISASDDQGGVSLVISFSFNPAQAVLYET